MRRNWLASLTKFYRLKDFTHSVFPSIVIDHVFACVCEVQLRLCVIDGFNLKLALN